MKTIIPITTLLVLLALGYWWLKVSKLPSKGLLASLIIDFIVILIIIITRPFIFSGFDANNIVLYFIYLATAGALFSVPVGSYKDQIVKEGHMPAVLKKILLAYLAYSILLLVLIVLEAFKLRGLF